MSTILLWDVDGTLLRNGKETGNLYHQAVELAAGRALEVALPAMHGKTDGQILTETLAAHGLDASLHAAARVHLDELSRIRHEAGMRREICPGIPEALAEFTARGWSNALLTGNSITRARFKIGGAGLLLDGFDWEHSYFGDVSAVRSELTIRAQEELLDHHLFVIGDTPADDVAAQAAGIPFLGVATGVYSSDDLRETEAALVIEDFTTGLDAVLAFVETMIRR